MPIYVEISRLYHCVTIVARGRIAPEEIAAVASQLREAGVPHFAKLIDVSSASRHPESRDQMVKIAAFIAGGQDRKRGPVAFLVDSAEHNDFARSFAATRSERPVSLFTSLHQARAWLEQAERGEVSAAAKDAADEADSPWSDPRRQAVMIRGAQQRSVPVRPGRPAYVRA
jgi:hypothetical protein